MKTHKLSRIISVMIKYTYLREGVFYYQRPIPDDLKSRYGKSSIKKSIKTSDPTAAAKKVDRLNVALEAEWERLRLDDSASPASLKVQARVLLSDWGLNPKGLGRNDPEAIDAFYSHIESTAGGDIDERPLDNVGPVEKQALEMLNEGLKPSLNDALEFYLSAHKKGLDEKFQKTPRLSVRQFVECVGDKALVDITRDDVRSWMAWGVDQGHSGGTIDRRLNSLGAIVSMFIREKELDIPNRFEKHTIPAGAKEAKKRTTFTTEELDATQKACIKADDDIRWIIAILSDTCTRLAEVAGLRLEDIDLDHETPHINIVIYTGRSLKTDEISERSIPLVGAALWAARRVKERATKGQKFAFPRYVKEGKCETTAASATMNKWIRSLGVNHTTHEFRHTMKDRLRDVGCPKEMQDQIGGWSRDMSEKYGLGFRLQRTREYLIKTILPSVEIPTA